MEIVNLYLRRAVDAVDYVERLRVEVMVYIIIISYICTALVQKCQCDHVSV